MRCAEVPAAAYWEARGDGLFFGAAGCRIALSTGIPGWAMRKMEHIELKAVRTITGLRNAGRLQGKHLAEAIPN